MQYLGGERSFLVTRSQCHHCFTWVEEARVGPEGTGPLRTEAMHGLALSLSPECSQKHLGPFCEDPLLSLTPPWLHARISPSGRLYLTALQKSCEETEFTDKLTFWNLCIVFWLAFSLHFSKTPLYTWTWGSFALKDMSSKPFFAQTFGSTLTCGMMLTREYIQCSESKAKWDMCCSLLWKQKKGVMQALEHQLPSPLISRCLHLQVWESGWGSWDSRRHLDTNAAVPSG